MDNENEYLRDFYNKYIISQIVLSLHYVTLWNAIYQYSDLRFA